MASAKNRELCRLNASCAAKAAAELSWQARQVGDLLRKVDQLTRRGDAGSQKLVLRLQEEITDVLRLLDEQRRKLGRRLVDVSIFFVGSSKAPAGAKGSRSEGGGSRRTKRRAAQRRRQRVITKNREPQPPGTASAEPAAAWTEASNPARNTPATTHAPSLRQDPQAPPTTAPPASTQPAGVESMEEEAVEGRGGPLPPRAGGAELNNTGEEASPQGRRRPAAVLQSPPRSTQAAPERRSPASKKPRPLVQTSLDGRMGWAASGNLPPSTAPLWVAKREAYHNSRAARPKRAEGLCTSSSDEADGPWESASDDEGT